MKRKMTVIAGATAAGMLALMGLTGTAMGADAGKVMQQTIHRGSLLFASSALGSNGRSCMTCHRGGGMVQGRLPNGKIIPSLKGVAAKFPQYNAKAGKVITLDMRINSCIQNALGGMPLSYNGKRMVAMVSYLTSLSEGNRIQLAGAKS